MTRSLTKDTPTDSPHEVIQMVSKQESGFPGYFHQKFIFSHLGCVSQSTLSTAIADDHKGRPEHRMGVAVGLTAVRFRRLLHDGERSIAYCLGTAQFAVRGLPLKQFCGQKFR